MADWHDIRALLFKHLRRSGASQPDEGKKHGLLVHSLMCNGPPIAIAIATCVGNLCFQAKKSGKVLQFSQFRDVSRQ